MRDAWNVKSQSGQRNPITKHRIRFTFQAVFLICILTSYTLAACRSGGIRVESWEDAIRFAQVELDAAGDLAGRIEGYDRTAAEMSAKIGLLDQARPAFEMIDKLRAVQVPLIGNGWQILLAMVGTASVDGAKIIAQLEETLRSLTELKHSLDYLNGLSAVAKAVRVFRAEPTRRRLLALSSTSASATPSMQRLHAELGEILNPLQDVTGGFGALLSGLRGAADADVPIVSEAAGEAAERLSLIEDPLVSLRDELDQLHQGIEADRKVLERIQEAVRQAKKLNE
jgi:hypothetical protein